MPSGGFVTPLDVAAQVDRILRRNIQWPNQTKVFADSPVAMSTLDRATMCNAVGGNMVVTLPDATLNKGMDFIVKKTDASTNTVTIQAAVGGQTIDGAGAKVLVAENDFIVVESDGSNYKVIALLISTPGSGGAVFYNVEKIYKTDGVGALSPIPGTQIPFTVAVDGECFFAANGVFAGFTGLFSVDLAIYVDGVLLCHSSEFSVNGSGGDGTGPVTQSPNGSKFLAAGPHLVELVAGQVNLSLQASAADPLTLSVLYPAASFNTAAPTPKAATFVVHPVPGVGDFTTIEAALAAIAVLGGGYILVREGTYTPPAGGYILPDCPVEIIGCASDVTFTPNGTTIDATAHVGPIFVKSFKHNYRIADMTVLGSGLVNQSFFDATAVGDSSGWAIVENVVINQVQNGFVPTAASGDLLLVRMSKVIFTPALSAASKLWSNGAAVNQSGKLECNQCTVVASVIEDNPDVTLTGCYFDCTNTGGGFVNLLASLFASSCELFGEFKCRNSRGSAIEGCSFSTGIFGAPPARYLDFAQGIATVTGCEFLVGATSEDIRASGATAQVNVANCTFAGSGASGSCISLTTPSGSNIVNCDFHGGSAQQILINATSVDVTIVGCNFTDDGTAPRAIDILGGAGRSTIVGNNFKFFDTEAIQIAGFRCAVVGNTGCKVVETAAANLNIYTANGGFDPSTISVIGNASLIENENVREIDVNSALDEFTRTVVSNVAGGSITLTLPTAASAKWRKYIIKKIDASANTVTIDADGAETIDGALTFVLTVQYQAIEIQSDGTQWWIV